MPRISLSDALPESVRTSYLIARREFLTRARSRVFLIGTLLLVIIIPGYIALQALVINRTTSSLDVAFQGPAQRLSAPLESASTALGIHVRVSTVPDLATGKSGVEAGRFDALVSGDPLQPAVTVKDRLDPTLAAALSALVRQAALDQALSAGGLDPATIDARVAAARPRVVTLDATAAQQTQRIVVGIFVAALLYVALLVYGQIVAQGVVEEKSNRIVEVLLSTVRPRELLLGKVIGIGLLGLLQLLVVGVAGLVSVAATGALTIPQLGVTAVAGSLLWFLLGFLLYALLYAAGGSLVSRQEDVAPVTMPITVLIVGTYLAIFWVLSNADTPLAAVLSVLPPLAPILMPARMATGDAQAWQVIVGLVLTVATIAALNAGAARIYANSVLRTGSRVRLRDAWGGPV